MDLRKATQIINSYDFNEIAEFQDGVMQEAIDTVVHVINTRILDWENYRRRNNR